MYNRGKCCQLNREDRSGIKFDCPPIFQLNLDFITALTAWRFTDCEFVGFVCELVTGESSMNSLFTTWCVCVCKCVGITLFERICI